MNRQTMVKMTNSKLDVLSKRQEYSKNRLNELSIEISKIHVLRELSELCIYVTGSFGRLEASEHSDLDLFFVHKGSFSKHAVQRIDKILLDSSLIEIARKLSFPDFSNDGEYLTVHYFKDIETNLGGREDDYKNHFTARLLLLLESRPLHNEKTYDKILQKIIRSYFRDYHHHEKDFRPIFLINDIMRFWRTLCLNYEHRRNRQFGNEYRRHKSHIINLKLKFSRLLTCHSAIALLSMNRGVVDPNELLNIVKLSPWERLNEILRREACTEEYINSMKDEYSWFLDKTGREEAEVLNWIADENNRAEAFDKGRFFATNMYNTLCKVTAGADTMRYLVV